MHDECPVKETISKLEVSFNQHLAEHTVFEKSLAENTEMTRRIADNTDEMVQLLRVVRETRGFINTVKKIGKFVVWLSVVCGATVLVVSTAVALFKHINRLLGS